MKILRKKAYAKINLGLQVLNKRPDGFHNINTLFIRCAPFDELEFIENTKFEFECDGELNIPNEQNIAYKAAKYALKNHSFDQARVKISLSKRIPSGAGLGGGSSDAAAVLSGLNEFLELRISREELAGLATRLGGDVPYFLKSGAATASGKGEKLQYFDFETQYALLIAFPNISVSTAEAYAKLERCETFDGEIADFKKVALEGDLSRLFNDFESSVFNETPEIARVKERLTQNGALFSMMSGSGSSVFAFFKSGEQAEIAASALNNCQAFISSPALLNMLNKTI